MIRLTQEQAQAIRTHGEDDFPHECCGVILGDVVEGVKIVRELRRLTNTHEEGHERRYLIAPEEMLALQREEFRTKRKILGFYHSHPNHPAEPSIYDRDWAWAWWTYVIVSVREGVPERMRAWQLDEEREAFFEEDLAIDTDERR